MAKTKQFDRLDTFIQIRTTSKQIAAWRRAAKRESRTPSNWIRHQLDMAAKRELDRS
ncbi:MAG: hypothetical protein IH830_02900 [Planctomycetes bacterium]|nr:hypothetical protein [Planctomycetota bacterium]